MSKKLLLALIPFLLILASFSESFAQRGKEVFKSNVWGEYHALIIGINAYKEWPELKTAVNDAKGLKDILIGRYAFDKKNVIFRTDKSATRIGLIYDLRHLASKLDSQDNLLIYFAGHGQLDDLTGDGYWIPVEGELKNPATWISHSTIKNILCSEKLRAKNIVIIADSCYSGSLLRGGPSLITLDEHAYTKKVAELASLRSRQVITSGGLEPVVDGGRDGYSLFAYYFLKALKENKREVIDLENLFHTQVWKYVTEIGGQRPNVGRLKTPMDEDGQFVLLLKAKTASTSDLSSAKEESSQNATLEIAANVKGATVTLNGEERGVTPLKVADIAPGKYELKVSKKGYHAYEEGIRVVGGKSISLDVTLEPVELASAIIVAGNPKGAKVYMDGYYCCILPCTIEQVSIGKHTVKVKNPGYIDRDVNVSVTANGQELQLRVDLEKEPKKEPKKQLIGRVTSVQGNAIKMDLGQEEGIKIGDRYRVYFKVTINGKEQPVYIAWIKVTGVTQKSCTAQIVEKTGDVQIGYLVEVTLQEAKEAPPSKKVVKKEPKAGQVWKDPYLGMEFVWVPGGCYEMGCGSWTSDCGDFEKPVHTVCVDGFWIGRYEVTQDQWRRLMGDNPSRCKDCGGNCPVDNVPWNMAVGFAQKLSQKIGYDFRLPTEAEWEYACRSGGRKEKYAGGRNANSVAWSADNSEEIKKGVLLLASGRTHPVGQKRPNGLGIYDMSGNVSEWCQDWFNTYSRSQKDNPQGPSSGRVHVIRGGCIVNTWIATRCSARGTGGQNSGNALGDTRGLRLVRVAQQ